MPTHILKPIIRTENHYTHFSDAMRVFPAVTVLIIQSAGDFHKIIDLPVILDINAMALVENQVGAR